MSFLVRECRHPVPGCVSARWWPVADEFQGSQGRVAEIRDRGLGGDMSLFSPDGVHLPLGLAAVVVAVLFVKYSTEYSCIRTAKNTVVCQRSDPVFVFQREKGQEDTHCKRPFSSP